jgi:hypothetical protein
MANLRRQGPPEITISNDYPNPAVVRSYADFETLSLDKWTEVVRETLREIFQRISVQRKGAILIFGMDNQIIDSHLFHDGE